MNEVGKIKFDVLSYEEVVDLLSWTVFESEGALPLRDATFDLYPQLAEINEYLEKSKDDKEKVYELIFEDLQKFYQKYLTHSKKMVKRYGLIWEPFNDDYINALCKCFNMDWPSDLEEITALIGRVPVCPRFIKDKKFYIGFYDADTIVDICMHELCHFIFFAKCKELFPRMKIDTDNKSLFWFLSEIIIDPVLNKNEFKKIFKHKFKSYDVFYNVRFGNELLMDKIRLFFANSHIDEAIKESYEYLQKHEYSFRKQCGDFEKDEIIEVRMD